jgi:hypothetical protein
MALHLAKALAAFGLGLGLSGCLTTQPPALEPVNAVASQNAAPDRYPLLARYDACVRAAFADQYQKNVEKGAAVDLAFAACATDEQALNRWFAEYPVASAPIRAGMPDRKSKLKAELIARYP